jgi:hypothetical protein
MYIRDIIAYFDSLDSESRKTELEILNRLYGFNRTDGPTHAATTWTIATDAAFNQITYSGGEAALNKTMPTEDSEYYGRTAYSPENNGTASMGEYQGPYRRTDGHLYYVHAHTGMVVAADTLEQCYLDPRYKEQYLDPRTGQRLPAEQYTAPANMPPVEPLPKACEPSMSKVPCIVLVVADTGELVQLSTDASEEFLIWKSKQGRYGWSVCLEGVGLLHPYQVHYVPDNYRPLALQINNNTESSRIVMVHPSITTTLPEGKDTSLGYPGIIEISRHGYRQGEIAAYNTYVYPYGPESTSEAGAVAYTRVLERLARLYDGDIERDRILEKEVEDFSFGDEGLVDENKRNRIHLHRQDFYRLIREMGLYKEIGSGIQWVEGWAEGKSVSGALYRRHLSTFIRNGGEVGYENNQFYVAYSK